MRIELSGIEFRYGQETILQEIELSVASGSLCVICGQTGSGKSTLLQVIAGLEKPSAGSVVVGEADPNSNHEQRAERLAKEKLAIVFQMPETQLFAATVKADVEYGLILRNVPKEERLERVKRALRQVGLEPSAFLERSPYLLSGGEKRRVAIAGALALQPEVLILDEPTAGLDPRASRDLREIVGQLRDLGMTVIVSTHDLDAFFSLADQVAVIQKGCVVYTGDPRQLVQEPDILQQAGLDLPETAQIAHALQKRGIPVPIALTVDELLPYLEKRVNAKPATIERMENPAINRNHREETLSENREATLFAEGAASNPPADGKLQRLDPRVKWFALLVLSLAILGIETLLGMVLATGMVLLILQMAGIGLRTVFKMARPFLWMLFFIWIVSALTLSRGDLWFGPVGIRLQGAWQGGLTVVRFLLVIVLGIVFTETTSGAPLREGFEWLIRPMRKAGIPVRDVSLAVSITLQFVPWMAETITRLRKAFKARGYDTIGMRKWTPNQLANLFIPLLITVIRLGDELATAIESRGYDRNAERTSWHELEWGRSDTVSLAVITIAAGMLWIIGS
jgi:energy-coupling factor transport system ATP-binding protein